MVLEQLANLMKAWIDEGHMRRETLYGIEVLNEPAGYIDRVWEECRDRFYDDSYEVSRSERSKLFHKTFPALTDSIKMIKVSCLSARRRCNTLIRKIC